MKKKITYAELCKKFREWNEKHDNSETGESITGVIVFRASNWDTLYSLESRSYRVSSNNRGFQIGKIANSIFGNSLDGTDRGVRLDWYMFSEEKPWKIDYCYLDKENAR